ncbi:MAG TPA: SUMF1/EgtB/PvdO family nonheme iron enzyme [Thermodesulfovibrionales bacterium]|nr:SUMF1/EgtB/PvdO family nonheme iron enzyme [Thermodesulfovibrionales bacterium]
MKSPNTFGKYAKVIIFIGILIIVFGFFLIPQFSGLRRESQHSQERLKKESLPQLRETQQSSPASISDYTDPVTGMEFIFVKGGCFDMGDTFGDGDSDEKPVHQVCLADFYIGKYEVIATQWLEVMRTYPREFRGGRNDPVAPVSWNLAQAFIRNLNQRTGKNYRLPTEAEWEYAARSGGKNERWAGTSDPSLLGAYAWYDRNSGGTVHAVGQKKPNGLGLYDMSGNVGEWVADWYDGNYYSHSTVDNPQGPGSGSRRVQRGGGWFYQATFARTTNRGYIRVLWTGFRLAMTPRS